jgi:hypothetical protein
VVPGRGTVFRYNSEYDGPPLSPDLDYRTGQRQFAIKAGAELRPSKRRDLFPVFEAALPGEWGERVLADDQKFGRAYLAASPAEKLYLLGDRRVGALYFQPEGGGKELCEPVRGEEALAKMERKVEYYLAMLATALGTDRERWALTSNGGRQPKVAYIDNHGHEYVAKFTQEVDGSYELPRVEAAMLDTSRAAGLNTADSMLLELGGNGRAALLSKRFDRETRQTVDGKRIVVYRHKMGLDAIMLGGRPAAGFSDEAEIDYVDIAIWLQQNSSDPDSDVADLYGRMLLNAFANNTDDHPGNFEVMQDEHWGWRLAPNFDLLIGDDVDQDGKPRRRHRMTMAGESVPPYDVEWMLDAARQMGVSDAKALDIAHRVVRSVQELPDLLAHHGCRQATMKRVVPCLQLDRLATLRDDLEGRIAAKQSVEIDMDM